MPFYCWGGGQWLDSRVGRCLHDSSSFIPSIHITQFKLSKQIMNWLIIAVIAISILQSTSNFTIPTVLSTIDFTKNYQESSFTFPNNMAGLSYSFPQIYATNMNQSLFQSYISGSRLFGSSRSNFAISLKVQYPMGYKYNCSAYTAMGRAGACIFDYSAIMTRISAFCKNAGPTSLSRVSIGFDLQKSDFTNTAFNTFISSYFSTLRSTVGASTYPVPIELFDQADKLTSSGILPNYTASSFVNDMNTVSKNNPDYIFYGPGITESAGPEWLATFSQVTALNKYFTVKCNIFKSSTNYTIADVLDENNYRNYITNRFISNGEVINAKTGPIIITEARLSDGIGIDGITNTFVSALWAVDFTIEAAMFGLKGVHFPVDISATSKQTVIGPSPSYTPQPIYYGLLFISMLSYANGKIGLPSISAGSSSKIKAYGLTSPSQMQIVLINKDTNTSASGVVEIKIQYSGLIECLYLSSAALIAKTGITFGNVYFNGGSATPQGTYATFQYSRVDKGIFHIPLNYSQAALCYMDSINSRFPSAN